ncbi:N-acetylmuramic acid 6-phosphate etherase [Tropicimonas sp. IMCC6043]|uniref:N-acetylmuramic acid 6-phosphate etherase n=1 Tax=Tropicimonas sp. IMCC6043 TaxID=2510645 RepID=UPI00101D5B73|nr:N-acetylmuramic acid 6-phosphate etherase [Tropicimonas sp. IMCC6043]RYH08664.1 N-acetylmuramic acid 6-phosphate etherase [Tropicimonas sp. IMCC6043]
MHKRGTEELHPDAPGLDARPLSEIAAILLDGQMAALASMDASRTSIAAAAELMADAIRAGKCLHYAAAGSSGLMALADASELEATFGLDASRIALHMAGGVPVDARMPGATEDDDASARAATATVAEGDVVIALSASGTTPYPLAFLDVARSRGARTIAIANNPGAPIFEGADISILLPTPPEVLAGSTRMGAGTAQKAALNMMSTLMGIALGHVHDGMMVNVLAENAKLRRRAAGMVSRIAGVPEATAADCLAETGGKVKPAVLLALGAGSLAKAEELLEQSRGHLRPAMAQI